MESQELRKGWYQLESLHGLEGESRTEERLYQLKNKVHYLEGESRTGEGMYQLKSL